MDGVIVTPIKRIPTAKGDVLHALKASDAGFAGFGEAYFSTVLHGVVKGWKQHQKMTMNLVVCCGAVRFVIYDSRPDSQTNGDFFSIVLSPDAPDTYVRLTVPKGVWMAFQGEGSKTNIVLNIASIEHDPDEAVSVPLEQFSWNWDAGA